MHEKLYDVAAVGAALVDTEILVNDADIATSGLTKGRMTLTDTHQQARTLGKIREHLDQAARSSGGSAANSLIALALLGGRAHLTCQVGDDEDGRHFTQDLTNNGVDFNQRGQFANGVTGTCLVLITPDAERTMSTALGISEKVSADNVEAEVAANSQWIYLEGYAATSETGRQAALTLATLGRSKGAKIALSLSDPGIVAHFGKELDFMASAGLDLIFGNREEILARTGCTDVQSAADLLAAKNIAFAITLGAEGALVGDAQGRWHVPAEAVVARDTNGAGDAFAGAYLFAINRGATAYDAGLFACRCAGIVVSRMGPRLAKSEAENLNQWW